MVYTLFLEAVCDEYVPSNMHVFACIMMYVHVSDFKAGAACWPHWNNTCLYFQYICADSNTSARCTYIRIFMYLNVFFSICAVFFL
jgi:hypothetical protein